MRQLPLSAEEPHHAERPATAGMLVMPPEARHLMGRHSRQSRSQLPQVPHPAVRKSPPRAAMHAVPHANRRLVRFQAPRSQCAPPDQQHPVPQVPPERLHGLRMYMSRIQLRWTACAARVAIRTVGGHSSLVWFVANAIHENRTLNVTSGVMARIEYTLGGARGLKEPGNPPRQASRSRVMGRLDDLRGLRASSPSSSAVSHQESTRGRQDRSHQ
jgi:hypothetical protein